MPVIEIENLHKRYGRHVAVHDVSFTVERGEIFGILGPNGAGKTTTVECAQGLRTRDGGTVRVLGSDPATDRLAVRRKVGVQLQETQLPDRMRVAEALDLYSSFYPDPADWRTLLAELGLADKADTPFKKLSGGQKQRLSVALALVGNPEIAILDELTTGMDPQARRDTWQLVEDIRARGVTVLLVTHFMEEAERLCDRLALIDAGRVVAVGTPAGLVAEVDAEQRVRFRPSAPLDDRLLTGLPEVTGVTRTGNQVLVTGTGNLLHALTSALAAQRITAVDLRVEQASLEDAFVALTGRHPDRSHRPDRADPTSAAAQRARQ
ncbi:ABC transporter ATP-binding protein [Goodfellowiella coeruleoviolacea]|nr:ABC transporter ATP-binding protein [Goodfellowiella coeruleoviolacea]